MGPLEGEPEDSHVYLGGGSSGERSTLVSEVPTQELIKHQQSKQGLVQRGGDRDGVLEGEEAAPEFLNLSLDLRARERATDSSGKQERRAQRGSQEKQVSRQGTSPQSDCRRSCNEGRKVMDRPDHQLWNQRGEGRLTRAGKCA